jgi:predicted RNA polymerase sigma factor
MSIDRTDAGISGASDKNHSAHQHRNAKDNTTSKDGTSAVDDKDYKDDNRLVFLAQPRHSFISTPRSIALTLSLIIMEFVRQAQHLRAEIKKTNQEFQAMAHLTGVF